MGGCWSGEKGGHSSQGTPTPVLTCTEGRDQMCKWGSQGIRNLGGVIRTSTNGSQGRASTQPVMGGALPLQASVSPLQRSQTGPQISWLPEPPLRCGDQSDKEG